MYTCVDWTEVSCRLDVAKATDEFGAFSTEKAKIMPKNGIWRIPRTPTIAVIAGTQTSRDMAEIIQGNASKTYTFPSTIITVRREAFED